jgi:hypothetical protein
MFGPGGRSLASGSGSGIPVYRGRSPRTPMSGRSPTRQRASTPSDQRNRARTALEPLMSVEIADRLSSMIDRGTGLYGEECYDLQSFFDAIYRHSTNGRKARPSSDEVIITVAALRNALLEMRIAESAGQLPTVSELGRRNRVSFSDLKSWMMEQLEELALGVASPSWNSPPRDEPSLPPSGRRAHAEAGGSPYRRGPRDPFAARRGGPAHDDYDSPPQRRVSGSRFSVREESSHRRRSGSFDDELTPRRRDALARQARRDSNSTALQIASLRRNRRLLLSVLGEWRTRAVHGQFKMIRSTVSAAHTDTSLHAQTHRQK